MDELVWRQGVGLGMLDGSLEHAFEERLPEYTSLAFRVAYGVLHNREDAEEVAQEAMLKAYRKLRSLRDRDRFRPWIVRLTWRLALDRQRASRRRQGREDAAPAPTRDPSPEELAASNELRDYVWNAIAELPEKQRQVLILATIEEHDVASVARLLNVPVGTVKSRLHKARKLLLERLKWIATSSKNP